MNNYKYDIKQLKPLAHGQWISILKSAGIDAHNTKHTPCPICNKSGCFRAYEKSENLTYTCSCSYGDGFKLLVESKAFNFNDALQFVGDWLNGSSPKPSPNVTQTIEKPKVDLSKKKAFMHRTIKNTYHTTTKPAQDYYLSRGLTDIPRIESLQYGAQWYMDMPLKDASGVVPKHPVIVAKLSEFQGETQAIVRTYTNKADISALLPASGKVAKKPFLSAVDRLEGAGCWLTNTKSGVLHASEGLENMLSVCTALNDFNAVAGITSALMGSLIIPDHVYELHVWADNGKAGIKSAELLRGRYEKNIDVFIHYPSDKKQDWNNTLEKGFNEIRQAFKESFI